jgi:hypothetical protein
MAPNSTPDSNDRPGKTTCPGRCLPNDRCVSCSVFPARTLEEIAPAINEAKASDAAALQRTGDAAAFLKPSCRDRARCGTEPASHVPMARSGGRGRPCGLRSRVSPNGTVSGLGCSLKYCAAPNRPNLAFEQPTRFELAINLKDREGARPQLAFVSPAARRSCNRMSAPGKAGAILPVRVRPK